MKRTDRVNPLNPLWKPDPVAVYDSDGQYLGMRWEAVDSHECKPEPLDPDYWPKDIVELLGFQCSECGMLGVEPT